MLLSEITPNTQVTVISFDDTDLELKLLEFGINIGSKLTVERKAPFGGPILLITQNGKLALRKDEASQLTVSPLS